MLEGRLAYTYTYLEFEELPKSSVQSNAQMRPRIAGWMTLALPPLVRDSAMT